MEKMEAKSNKIIKYGSLKYHQSLCFVLLNSSESSSMEKSSKNGLVCPTGTWIDSITALCIMRSSWSYSPHCISLSVNLSLAG
jgi:hypothetical protein